jgi:hypothetical protein
MAYPPLAGLATTKKLRLYGVRKAQRLLRYAG